MHSFTHQHMATLLNIQGLIIYNVEETEQEFEVKVGQPRRPKECKYCKEKDFKKNGKGKLRRLRHGIVLTGKPLFLLWQGQRYYCRGCQRTWTKSPPTWLVKGRRRSTSPCELQALRTLKGTSFSETKKQNGVGYSILRRSLEENVQSTSLLQLPQTGEISIGVDEHSRVKRTYATTITLLKPEEKLIGLLPVKNNKSLEKWVEEHWTDEQRYRVTEICVDMAKCWKYVLPGLFPNAKMVIDHFHVIAYLNQLIATEYRLTKQVMGKNKTRELPQRTTGFGVVKKLYQGGAYWSERDKEKIKKVFQLMPRVAELWYWKEEVRRIYWECLYREEARIRWQVVLSNLKHLDPVAAKTLTEYLEGIVNYFDKRTTNAFTEGIHTKFKLIKRYSYGLRNPDVYVKKIILGFLSPKTLIHSNTY